MNESDNHLIFVPSFDPWGPWRQLHRHLETRVTTAGTFRVVSLANRDQLPDPQWRRRFPDVQFEWLPLRSGPFSACWSLRRKIREWAPAQIWNWGGGPPLSQVIRGSEAPWVEIQFSFNACAEQPYRNSWGRQPDRFLSPHSAWSGAGFLSNYQVSLQRLPSLAPLPLANERQRSEARQELRTNLGIPADATLISSIAPLVPETALKNVCWGFDLLSCIREEVYLLIVGTGSHRWQLERFCRTLDCRRKIRIVERLGDEAVLGADVYWNSNIESVSSGALAAMAWEVPVVTVITSETATLFRHQQTVLGVEPDSRDQFARWTKFLLERPDDRKLLTQQALELVELDYQTKLDSDIFRLSAATTDSESR